MPNDHKLNAKEESGYKDIPIINNVSADDVAESYNKIKNDIVDLFINELKKTPAPAHKTIQYIKDVDKGSHNSVSF